MTDTNITPELLSLKLSLKSKLSEKIEADMKQAEFYRTRAEKNLVLFKAIKGSLTAEKHQNESESENGYDGLRDALRQAVSAIPNERFTSNDVRAEIAKQFPGSGFKKEEIGRGLWILASRNEIKVIRKGTGRIPAQYQKIAGVLQFRQLDEEALQQTAKNGR
jgi:hypothetical protein